MKQKRGKIKAQIFKIQLPLFGDPMALVYNRNRDIEGQVPVTSALVDQMQGKSKLFFYGRFHDGEIDLLNIAPWQEW